MVQPLLRIFTKSSYSALQTVLHVLFLPTPFKSSVGKVQGQEESTTEVLKPGSFYANCSVQALKIPQAFQDKPDSGKSKIKGEDEDTKRDELPDDGELGGEALGRSVWESFEQALKIWEKMSSPKVDSSSSAVEHSSEDPKTKS
jgi:hypothetical protein